MKAYLTRHALTNGIVEAECELDGKTISFKNEWGLWIYERPPYWHETIEKAKEHAEEMRVRKIAALRKQIAKLEAMKF